MHLILHFFSADPTEKDNLAGNSSFATILQDMKDAITVEVPGIVNFNVKKNDKCTAAQVVVNGLVQTDCCV